MATPDTSTATFTISYEGPALQDGRMDVRDLAPALLALGDLLHEAGEAASPDAPTVNLDIRAFREGSFIVDLEVVVATAITLLSSTPATAASNLVQLTHGLFSAVKRLRGKRVVNQEETSPGKTRLTLSDGTSLETDSPVVFLLQNESARRHTRAVLAPLDQHGIDDLKIEAPGEPELTLVAEDAEVVQATLDDTPLIDDERDMAVTLSAVAFEPGKKWRLNDGGHVFWASIDDSAFVRRVQLNQEAFRAGDILICRVRVRQWQTENGLRSDYTVIRVQDHIPGARDVPLPFEGDGDDG